MANLLEVLGVSPDDMGSVPQDIKDASSLLEGMQDIYEEMPISKRKEEFANVISEGVKQLLIRLGALTRLGVQSTQNIQQQLPQPKDYRGSLYVETSIMDDYKTTDYTIYVVSSDFTFPNGQRTISSVFYKRNDNVQYFVNYTIEELEDLFATNEMTLLPFKIGDVLKLEKSINAQVKPSGDIYTYISINGYSEKGFNITFWSEGVNDNIITIIEDKTDFSIFENFGIYVKDMNIVQYLTKYTNSGNFVKVDNVQVPTNQSKNLDDLIPLSQAQGVEIPSGTKGLRIFTDEKLGTQNPILLNIAPIEIQSPDGSLQVSNVPIGHFEDRGYIVKTNDYDQLYRILEGGKIYDYERIDFVVEGDIVLLEYRSGKKALGEVKFNNSVNEWYIEQTSGSSKGAILKQDYLFGSQNTNPSTKLYEGVKSIIQTSTPTPPQTSTPQPPTITPTPPTPPPSKPTKPSKPTPPKTSTPPPPPTSTPPPEPPEEEMTKKEIEDAIKGLKILAKFGDEDAKASIKGLKVLLKYAK
jgi:hypothetical protein